MQLFLRSLFVSLGFIIASSLYADDFESKKLANWPHWRGPFGNGVAPNANPPIEWDEKTNIKWKVEIPGKGSATPIVWEDQVFIVTAIKTDRKIDPKDLPKVDPKFEKKTERPLNYYQFVVLSLDRETGKLRWKDLVREVVPHEGIHPTHSYAAGSPTTDGKFLYVSFGSQGIYCYTLDGKQIWKRDLGKLHSRFGWGEAVTPVVYQESLFINWDQEFDSKLYCLDTKTGKTKWEVKRDEKTSWNTPCIVEHRGKTQVVLNGTNRIRSYDAANGEAIWECPGMTVNAIPSPIAKEGVLYCVSGYGGAGGVAISLDAKGVVQEGSGLIWKVSKGTPYVPSPILVNDRLYFTKANAQLFSIVDTRSGKVLADQERLPHVRSFYSSPASAKDRIYLADQTGVILVIKASKQVEVLSTNRLNDRIDASPVLVGSQLFLRGEKYLWCIEEK